MDFPFNFFIIPGVIIFLAVSGNKVVKKGVSFYKSLKKPKNTPSGRLQGEIWTFIYVITGLSVLWFWNVPVFTWFHLVVVAVWAINAYYHYYWKQAFFIEHDIIKSQVYLQKVFYTAIASFALMLVPSPISAFLIIPYVVWISLAIRFTKQIISLNKK